jgi:zona occludens toxin
MLYLISGANGAGKTLNTLKWVRERQLKENRPVCHNGRFDPVPGGELEGWNKIDFKDWQDQPDGTIFLIDEAHNDLPNRPAGSTVPDAVKMLAEHRKRGFDFYLITQHPQNIDSFVRRLIGPPGWHRHLKRSFGVDMVSVLEWSAVNPNCEKDGSGKTGTVTMQAFPKEVYGWYKSASLHTGKKRIPKQVWVLLLCLIAIPLLIWPHQCPCRPWQSSLWSST